MTSSRERFLLALHGRPTDRAPVAHVSALTTVALQQATGCWMPEVHLDPVKLVKLCGANHDMLGFDAVTFNINYFGEPAALGCQMDWGEPARLPTSKSNPWQRAEDAVIPTDLLQREPICTYLEATRLAREAYPDVGVIAKVMGPLSMVQAMHGLDRTMVEVIERPELIRHFLDVAVEVLIACANAALAAGADAVAIGEGGAGANMVSPRMHRGLLLEPHRRLFQGIQGPTVLHMGGDITPRLDMLREEGMTCYNFDTAITPEVMKAKAGSAFSLMGNVNTTDLLMGAPEQIAEQVYANLEAGIEMISPGGGISPNCPNENLRAMIEAVNDWTRRHR